MRRSVPLDHDPAAQNKTFRDLTVGVGCGSGGQGFSWAAAAAGTRRDGGPAAARGEKLAGLGQDRRSRVNSIRAWVREVRHAMREPPRASAGLGRALGGKSGGGGGSARQRSPACCSRAVLGSALGAKECGCVCRARANQNRAHTGIRVSPRSLPRRSGGGGTPTAAFRPQGRPKCHRS